jgi:hypothetical protein
VYHQRYAAHHFTWCLHDIAGSQVLQTVSQNLLLVCVPLTEPHRLWGDHRLQPFIQRVSENCTGSSLAGAAIQLNCDLFLSTKNTFMFSTLLVQPS